MPAPIEVITTLEFLGTDAAAVSTFGLLVQVGVPHAAQTPTPNVSLDDAALLQPWMWSNPTVQVLPWDGAQADAALTPLSAVVPPPSYAVAGNPSPTAIITALQAQFNDLQKTQPSEQFGWIDGESLTKKPGATQYSWPSRLSQLGRYPYPIPHRLQLAYLFRTANQISNGKYVGAVNFTVTVGGVATTYNTTKFVPGADATRVSIVYSGSVSGTTQPLEVKSPAFPLALPVVTGELTDWQTQLVSRAADMFDLSNRVVRSVRLATTPPENGPSPVENTNLLTAVANGFTGFVTAAVAAQRDIVAYGCRIGPDGTSLLNRTLSRWIIEKASPGEAIDLDTFSTQMQACVIAARKHDASDNDRFFQKWLTTLAAGPDFQGSSIVPPLPEPMSQIATLKAGQIPGPAKAGDLVMFDGQVFRCKHDGAAPAPPDGTGDATWQSDWDRVLTLTVPATIQQNQVSDRLLAVEHFQLKFTQKDVLTRILVAQWQAASATAAFSKPVYLQQFLGRATALLEELDIRGLLLRGNLGDAWSNVILPPVPAAGGPAAVTRDSLKTNLSKQFGNQLVQLFAGLPGTLACLPANACALRDACQAKLAAWLNGAIAEALPDSLQVPAIDAHQTEGLSVAIDAHVLDDTDSLEQGAGLVVLMRRQGTPTWRCLNLTYVHDDAGQSILADLAAVPVIAPVPEHLQEGLRRAILTYNNQPLMSKGPALSFSDKLVPSPDTHVSRIVHYMHPSFSEELDTSDARKIPGLAFGQSYEFYICRISNTGILPPELAVPGDPGLLKDLSTITVAPQGAVVSYTRRAKVNALRFGPNGGNFDKLQWPAIPADVTPYAREIGLANTSSDPDDPRPLLLLSSYATPASKPDFLLPIYKPTTDLLTWDRWMAGTDSGSGNTAIRQQRENDWKAFHYQSRRQSTKAKLSLDDPAVTGLVLTVTRVSSGAAPVVLQNGTTGDNPLSPKAWPATVPAAATLDNLFPMPNSAPPLNVGFNTVATGSDVTVQYSDSRWTISLPPGAVVSVTVTPVIDPSVKSFFAGNALPNLKSYTLVAEAADSSMPAQASLRQALSINPPGSAPGSVTFELPLSTMQSHDHWINVAAADLRTQEWRWDGRPVPPFPVTAMNGCISAATEVPPDLVPWELAVFLNRTLADATVRPMTRKQTTAAHATDYTFTALDDRSTEMGATYYRAAVQVKNRYGTLVPKDQRVVDTLDLLTASVPGDHGGWTRCFVPVRIPAGYQVPKPAVKFIVPLTGSEDPVTSQGASSVLVVVQGPWFAIGGLQEQFLVELTKHSEPPNPTWQETGPDPITYQGPQPNPAQTYSFSDSKGSNHFSHAANPAVDGYFLRDAVGHTFDSSDANPLWVNSSFVLDPPVNNGTPAPGGTFARVQFRRVISNPKPELTLCSDATDPVWVQFLPGLFSPFASAAPIAPTMDNVSLVVTANSVQLWANRKPVTLTADPNEDGTHTVFALLLTEQVSDLVGRSGQERFVRILFKQSAPNAASWSNPGGLPASNYVARILMIQRQTGTTSYPAPLPDPLVSEKQLWDEMFPPVADPQGDNPQQRPDAISRIVSVSRPISSQPANCATTQTMRN